MKLEVGMFVRTKNNGICKIKTFASTLTDDYIKNEKGSLIPKDEIIKTSHKIEDLIEKGDYVNGERVGYIDNCEGAMREYYYDYEDVAKDCGHWFEEIKSIVTREQFETMQYKVVEEC